MVYPTTVKLGDVAYHFYIIILLQISNIFI